MTTRCAYLARAIGACLALAIVGQSGAAIAQNKGPAAPAAGKKDAPGKAGKKDPKKEPPAPEPPPPPPPEPTPPPPPPEPAPPAPLVTPPTPPKPETKAGEATSTEAAATASTTMGGEHRSINGHYFIQPVDMPSAMVAGSVAFRQGFGVLTAELPTLMSVGKAIVGAGKLQYEQKNIFLYGQKLAGTIGIVNRVGIDLSAGGIAAIGGDMDSVVLLGAIAQLNVAAMPKVRIFTLENIGLQVTLGVGVDYSRSIHVSPFRLLSSTIDSLTKDGNIEAEVIRQTQEVAVTPALMIAEGIGPFGAQVFARPVIGVAGDAPGNAMDWGAHLAFDAGRLTQWAPVAITGEYMMDFLFASGKDPSTMQHSIGGGLYYTGRRDFSLGLVGQAKLAKQPDDTSLNMYLGQMTLQYYF